MNDISKISEITVDDIASFLRLTEVTDDEKNTLNTMLGIAKDFICQYTGIEKTDLDNFQDLIAVVFVLVQNMFDNRCLYVDNTNLNAYIETTLGLHQRNLL